MTESSPRRDQRVAKGLHSSRATPRRRTMVASREDIAPVPAASLGDGPAGPLLCLLAILVVFTPWGWRFVILPALALGWRLLQVAMFGSLIGVFLTAALDRALGPFSPGAFAGSVTVIFLSSAALLWWRRLGALSEAPAKGVR